MYAFEYHRPSTVAEAASLLQGTADSRLLAGGHTLIPTLKQRLASLLDCRSDATSASELGR